MKTKLIGVLSPILHQKRIPREALKPLSMLENHDILFETETPQFVSELVQSLYLEMKRDRLHSKRLMEEISKCGR